MLELSVWLLKLVTLGQLWVLSPVSACAPHPLSETPPAGPEFLHVLGSVSEFFPEVFESGEQKRKFIG